MEGECSFCISYPNNPEKRKQPSVQLSMTDEDVVKKVWEIFGKSGYTHWVAREDTYSGKKRKDAYHWKVTRSKDIVDMIDLMLPFLGQRRRAKAEEVKAIAEEIVARGHLNVGRRSNSGVWLGGSKHPKRWFREQKEHNKTS